tara:strand:+ start:22765 stop:25911 length:3147 start_codon:yes stop_codon:yes gene_type:complete
MVVYGSSYFKVVGATEVTGPTGNTGETGPTGPDGPTVEGPIGWSGGGITAMSINATDGLYTQFERFEDGGTSVITTWTTPTSIIGPTGNTETIIDGGNTYGENLLGFGGSGGATVFKVQDSSNKITIRSIEGTGGVLTNTTLEHLNTIDLNYDRGNFGYLDVTGGSGVTGQLVGGQLTGLTGATYNISGTSGGISVRLKSYRENSKYLSFRHNNDGAGTTYEITTYDGAWPPYVLQSGGIGGVLEPNKFGVVELDLTALNDFDYSVGSTGPIQTIDIADASFGYTGNNIGTLNDIGKSFTLIVKGATYGPQNNFQFSNVIWPFDRQPCFSGGTDIFNFFWLPCETRNSDCPGGRICPDGVAWHGNIVQWNSAGTVISEGTSDDPFFCHDREKQCGEFLYYPEEQVSYKGSERKLFGATGSTGACCRGEGECIHTIEDLCTGYWHGSNTVCGGLTSGWTGSICFDTGACCVHYTNSGKIECFNDLSVDDCINLGELLDVETSFGGLSADCRNMDCDNASRGLGACCDGRGGCSQRTRKECLALGYYFHGEGSVCSLDDGTEICYGGTGACYYSGGTCGNGITGSDCISGGNLYAGKGTKCEDTRHRTDEHSSCVPVVAGLDLMPGDEYAGGVVVGLYRPFGSQVFGSKSFGESKDADWQNLMLGATGSLSDNLGLTCDLYRSKYDWHGYGFTSEKGCPDYDRLPLEDDELSRPDAYYMIISPSPVAITGDRQVINYYNSDFDGATQEFYWGNRGSSWGPLHNPDTGQVDEIHENYIQTVFKLSEGYWFNENIGEKSLNVLGSHTFTSCRNARRLGSGYAQKLTTKPLQSAHGLWHRNWGIYNTIRIINADNVLYEGYDDKDGHYSSTDFGPGLTSDYISAFRATRLMDDNLTTITGGTGTNDAVVSSWYIPSHDEMSFIASNCVSSNPHDFDLNASLLIKGAVPLDGWHWTSTGAFDETKGRTASGEGVIGSGGSTADAGSLAWAMKFDINEKENNFLVGKKNRTRNTYKVRPIRLIRCDGKYATGGHANQKLWDLPKVIRDSDQGINQ